MQIFENDKNEISKISCYMADPEFLQTKDVKISKQYKGINYPDMNHEDRKTQASMLSS